MNVESQRNGRARRDAERRLFEAAVLRVDAEVRRLAAAPNRPVREAERLLLEEVWCSCLLAGAPLSLADVEALLTAGTTASVHALDAYVVVADYALAARFVATVPAGGRPRPYLRLDEIVRLHALAARRQPEALPGTWRTTTAPALPGGAVPAPAWLVPREMAAFTERVASGPPAGLHPLAWAADAHERFSRIHPFIHANGRINRLVTNLLLRRAGLPPFAVRGRSARAYRAALAQADARNPWPLAAVMARAVHASLVRLTAAADGGEQLRSLASFADGAARAALYKASQRGRLRTVRRAGALLTTASWIAEYEASRRIAATTLTPHDE